jgi:cytochrome c5
MTSGNRLLTRGRAWIAIAAAAVLLASAGLTAQTSFPAASDVEVFRNTIEPIFMKDRGGTMPGYASCVMCHTWQTNLRFSLQTPANDAGWTTQQSRSNFDVVTKLINTADPEASRLLRKPLEPKAGGLGHTGGTFWQSRNDAEYQTVLKWIRSLPKERYAQAPEPQLDFAFFRSCVQPIFRQPREGHIRCSNCHGGGEMGFAPVPANGTAWNDEEAKQAFRVITRLIVPGNAEQSRFLLKPLHPDGGGSYAHNGVRRWQTRDDPEWRMLADWVRGKRAGNTCS